MSPARRRGGARLELKCYLHDPARAVLIAQTRASIPLKGLLNSPARNFSDEPRARVCVLQSENSGESFSKMCVKRPTEKRRRDVSYSRDVTKHGLRCKLSKFSSSDCNDSETETHSVKMILFIRLIDHRSRRRDYWRARSGWISLSRETTRKIRERGRDALSGAA